MKVTTLSADAVLTEARALYSRWPDLPTDEGRKRAESLCEKIAIGAGEIDTTLPYLPTSEELTKTQQRLSLLVVVSG